MRGAGLLLWLKELEDIGSIQEEGVVGGQRRHRTPILVFFFSHLLVYMLQNTHLHNGAVARPGFFQMLLILGFLQNRKSSK